MDLSVTSHGGRVFLAAAVAAATLGGCANQANQAQTGRTAAPITQAPAPETPRPSPKESTPKESTEQRSVANPKRVEIPAIGVSAPIIALSIDRAGKLEAPKEYHVAGWNKAGPEPGERGTSVIAGHVDSKSGPAVFYRLRELSKGDRIEIQRVDGTTASFSVTRIVRHSKSDVPASVYAPASRPELRLVTCGGSFDSTRGSYRDNIIVYATIKDAGT